MSASIHPKNEAIGAELARMGYTMSVEFVPFSKSRNAAGATKPRPKLSELSINWRVTVKSNRAEYVTDYQEGIGHLPEHLRGRPTLNVAEAIAVACETGKARTKRGLDHAWNPDAGAQPLTPPTIAEVFCSLTLDGGAILQSFQEWCDDFGMDSDSIKAEKMYNACKDCGQFIIRTSGTQGLEKLQELFQDY